MQLLTVSAVAFQKKNFVDVFLLCVLHFVCHNRSKKEKKKKEKKKRKKWVATERIIWKLLCFPKQQIFRSFRDFCAAGNQTKKDSRGRSCLCNTLVAYNMLVAVFICLAFIKNEITRFLLFFFCFLVDMKSERQNWKFIPNIY